MGNAYLLSGLHNGPLIVKWIVERAPMEIYDTRTDPERFTFREIIAHLVDWEPIVVSRMRQTIERPGSVLIVWDEAQRAVDGKYGETDPREQAEKLIVLRQETIRFLQDEASGNWDATVTHPERGPQSLYDMANLELGHDTYHVEQLLQFLP